MAALRQQLEMKAFLLQVRLGSPGGRLAPRRTAWCVLACVLAFPQCAQDRSAELQREMEALKKHYRQREYLLHLQARMLPRHSRLAPAARPPTAAPLRRWTR